MTTYRTISNITADELLQALKDGGHLEKSRAAHQIALFVRLGGDPNDHNYARMSFLTRELRNRGVAIQSSKRNGIWLDQTTQFTEAA